MVSVGSLWADERSYYPIEVEPYTPAHHFEGGKAHPEFRTKPEIALELVEAALGAGLPFRAVVADIFYGEHRGFRDTLERDGVPYVVALGPSHAWWHRIGEPGSIEEVARASGWGGPDEPGGWTKLERTFRDGRTEEWWALEAERGPYGPEKGRRLVVATTDPDVLPERTTRYLRTNLPAPGSGRAETSGLASADVVEVVRLYGLRMWVEQSYKQVKQSLGWAQYQVRKDVSIRRHWQLVCSAFSFCWWAYGRLPAPPDEPAEHQEGDLPADPVGRQEDAGILAGSVEGGEGVAGALCDAMALLEGVLRSAPATGAESAARVGVLG